MFFESLIPQSNIKTWQISIVYTVYATKKTKKKKYSFSPLAYGNAMKFSSVNHRDRRDHCFSILPEHRCYSLCVFSEISICVASFFIYIYSPYLTTFLFILLLFKYLFRHRYTAAHKNIRTLVEIFCEYKVRSTMFHHFDDHYMTLLFIEGTKYLT